MTLESRPNILLIQSDQHRFDCAGVNGHRIVQTPFLDQIAREGINFTHAFCPIPLCVPVRNCMMFGQWAPEHLAISNWDAEAPRPALDGLPTFTKAIHNAGYYLGYVGKWHVHPVKGPLDYDFDSYVPEEAYGSWRAAQGAAPMPRVNEWFGECDPYITPTQSRLAWGADETIQMLQSAAQQTQPFFIRWDPSEPHLPNIVPEPYCSMYPPENIPPWIGFADSFEGKPYIQAQQLRTWNLVGRTWEEWAPTVGRYLGEITLLDSQIGRLLAELDRLGIADNTLVIYTSDHGDMCGSHGMIDKHHVMYDDVVHVPLMMRWHNHIAAGSTNDAFISHSIDLATTFCELAAAPVPDTFRGISLLPLMDGAPTNGRRDIFSTYHGNQFGLYSQRMVRERRWKYVWNPTAEDELYDLENDPGELKNLATALQYADELQRLRVRTVEWMQDSHDTLLNLWTRPQLLQGRKV